MGEHLVSRIAIAICLVSLIMGCTLHVVPSKIPPLDTKTEGLAGPYNNITVTLVNAQADNSDFSVKYLTDGSTVPDSYGKDMNGKDAGIVLSRKLWTEKLAEALGAELVTRQAKVVDGAPVIISLKVTEILRTLVKTGPVTQFRATAIVTLNSGWTKTYVGNGDAGGFGAPFGDNTFTRGANYTIQDLVRVIMSDPEFITEISKH